MHNPAIYRLGDSRVCLAVSRPGADTEDFLKPWTRSTLLWATHYVIDGQSAPGDAFETSSGENSRGFLRAYFELMKAGSYQVRYRLEAAIQDPARPASVDVTIETAEKEIFRQRLPLVSGLQEVGLNLGFSQDIPSFAFKLQSPENAGIRVLDCQIERR